MRRVNCYLKNELPEITANCFNIISDIMLNPAKSPDTQFACFFAYNELHYVE